MRFVKISLITILVLLTGCTQSNLGAGKKDWEKADSPLKLKAPKEKVLDSETVKDLRCDEDTGECEDNGDVKQYLYISDKKLDKETIEKDGKKYDEVKRTYNAIIYKEKKDNKLLGASEEEEYIGKFYGGTPFYEDENGDYYQTEIATTTIEAFDDQIKPTAIEKLQSFIGFNKAIADTDSYYSTASGDGTVRYYDSVSWDTAHDATVGTAVYATYDGAWATVEQSYSATKYRIERIFLPFNTSGLPDGASISAIDLNLYIVTTDNTDNDGKNFITVVQSTQNSPTTLSTDDYDEVGTTEGVNTGDRKSITTIATGGYTTWSLNSTGIGWISDTGYTQLALREGHDLSNEAPDAGNGVTGIKIYPSDHSGTSADPYLEITYTEGGGETETPTLIPEILFFN